MSKTPNVFRNRSLYTQITLYLPNADLKRLDKTSPFDAQKQKKWSRNQYLTWIFNQFIEKLPK